METNNPENTTKTNNTHTDKLYSVDKATYQNLAYSDVINIEIAGLWEDGYCSTNR